MWGLTVFVVMMALTGFYATSNKEIAVATEQARAEHLADNMAIYREAVITYFTQHSASFGSVDMATLKSSGALPNWSPMYVQPSIWANYRDADGMIYVYATTLPPVNITADIVRLSQNSMLAGVFRTGDTTLFSPVFGNTQIKLPPAGVNIPNGSPVWVAMRR